MSQQIYHSINLLDGVRPIKLLTLCVGDTDPWADGDVVDRAALIFNDTSLFDDASANGSRVSRVNRENIPRLASH